MRRRSGIEERTAPEPRVKKVHGIPAHELANKCEVCGKAFLNKRGLKLHKTKMHK